MTKIKCYVCGNICVKHLTCHRCNKVFYCSTAHQIESLRGLHGKVCSQIIFYEKRFMVDLVLPFAFQGLPYLLQQEEMKELTVEENQISQKIQRFIFIISLNYLAQPNIKQLDQVRSLYLGTQSKYGKLQNFWELLFSKVLKYLSNSSQYEELQLFESWKNIYKILDLEFDNAICLPLSYPLTLGYIYEKYIQRHKASQSIQILLLGLSIELEVLDLIICVLLIILTKQYRSSKGQHIQLILVLISPQIDQQYVNYVFDQNYIIRQQNGEYMIKTLEKESDRQINDLMVQVKLSIEQGYMHDYYNEQFAQATHLVVSFNAGIPAYYSWKQSIDSYLQIQQLKLKKHDADFNYSVKNNSVMLQYEKIQKTFQESINIELQDEQNTVTQSCLDEKYKQNFQQVAVKGHTEYDYYYKQAQTQQQIQQNQIWFITDYNLEVILQTQQIVQDKLSHGQGVPIQQNPFITPFRLANYTNKFMNLPNQYYIRI